MEKPIRKLIKQYKKEKRKSIHYRKGAIKRGDWIDVIQSEGSESFYDMIISDLKEILRLCKCQN